MVLLAAGVVLWIGLHLLPVAARGPRQGLIDKLGENGYKGIFSVLMLAAIALMVFGWRNALPTLIYLPPPALKPVAIGLTALGFILMAAANRPSRIGRLVRHPQLTGVLVWALAHLLANGDSRSLVLFGGFAVWAAVTIGLINHRDGPWDKPAPPSWVREIVGVLIGLVVFAVVIAIHPWIAGVPVW